MVPSANMKRIEGLWVERLPDPTPFPRCSMLGLVKNSTQPTPSTPSSRHFDAVFLDGMSVFPFRQRRTGADDVAVSVNIVHSIHGRPIFVIVQPFQGKAGLSAAVGTLPLFIGDIQRRVRRILERIVLTRKTPLLD